MNELTQEGDPVETGIREWQKVRAAAEEAAARCKVAEEHNAYLLGQNELLITQKKADDVRMRELQQRCDEMQLLVKTLGNAVASIIEQSNIDLPPRREDLRPHANGGGGGGGGDTMLEDGIREMLEARPASPNKLLQQGQKPNADLRPGRRGSPGE